VLLDDRKGAAKNVGESARFVDGSCFQINGDDKFSAEEESAFDRNERGQKAIDESASFIFYGNKETRVSAGSAKRRADRTSMVVDRQSEIDIRGGDGERLLQFLEAFYVSHARYELLEAIVGGEAKPRGSPTPEIGKLGFVGYPFHGFEGRACAIGHSNKSPDAGPGYDINRNTGLAKDPQNTNVGDTSRETASEGNADFGPLAAFWSATLGKSAEKVLGHAQKTLRVSVFLGSHKFYFTTTSGCQTPV
jgi:hypothetical protein